jgi:hypothetical protein
MTTVAMLRQARLKTVPHGELTYYEIVCESRSQKCSLCAQCERPPPLEAVLKTMRERAAKFNVDKIKPQDLAGAEGPPDEEG